MKQDLLQELLNLRESDKGLRKKNELQYKQIKLLERNIEALTQAILHAQKERFGPSSEKTPVCDGQMYLFSEAEAEYDLNPEETIHIHNHDRLKRKKGDKEKLIADIPREIVECVLNKDDENCEICGSELKVIGKKSVRTELEFIPAKLKVIEYIQNVYKCTTCGTTDEYPYANIIKAPVPAPVMKRSLASPSSVAWVIHQKYVLAVPLYRQEKEWKRMGISLLRSNMANWVIQCANSWLRPLYDRMKKKLVTYEIIMSDETTHQCNKEPGKKASSKSYFWMHRNGACESTPIILFEYTRTRAGKHAKKFLKEFSGFLVSDAYAGYEKVENITRCLCWSHLRRYYKEAIPLNSSKKEIKGSAASIGKKYCDKLFEIERKLKYLTPEERKNQRLIHSAPVLAAFYEWVNSINTIQKPLQKALNYSLNHKKYFMNFLLDGRIPISNNLGENAIRPVAVARKNYLFADTPKGAEANAIVFSIIETAVANKLDPFKYLVYIFKSLPNINFKDNAEILENYMPWSLELPESCHVTEKKE